MPEFDLEARLRMFLAAAPRISVRRVIGYDAMAFPPQGTGEA